MDQTQRNWIGSFGWEMHPKVHGVRGRWAFAEFCDVYDIKSAFKARVEGQFDTMIAYATKA